MWIKYNLTDLSTGNPQVIKRESGGHPHLSGNGYCGKNTTECGKKPGVVNTPQNFYIYIMSRRWN